MDANIFIMIILIYHKIFIFRLNFFQEINLFQNEVHFAIDVVFSKKAEEDCVLSQIFETRQYRTKVISWMHIIFLIADGARIRNNNFD